MSSTEKAKDRECPWEHGSDFHWFFEPSVLAPRRKLSWSSPGLLGSGRDAIRFAVAIGIEQRGWKRVHVPDYMCQEVVADLAERIEVRAYPCDPWTTAQLPDDLTRSDAVMSVPFFGMAPPVQRSGEFDLLEDHTHDPWSRWARESDAELCVASLRKTLPVPEGGVVWSPRGLPLPATPAPTVERELAATRKRGAMLLKAAYLAGADVDKSTFLQLFARGELDIASGATSGMTEATAMLVPVFPVAAWRDRRRAGHRTLARALAGVEWITPLSPTDAACPFVFVARLDTASRRDRVRQRLIQANVYPPVLWPLEETVVPVRKSAKELSQRILVLHCDARYDDRDLEQVAEQVRKSGEP